MRGAVLLALLACLAEASAQAWPTESLPGFEYSGWFVLVAPTGAPPAIVRRINHDMDRVLSDPDTVQRMEDLGVTRRLPARRRR